MTTKITETSFLDERIGQPITIYLVNGIKLIGVLTDHDLDVLFLTPHTSHDNGMQMISKTAISTVVSEPIRDITLSTPVLEGILSSRRACEAR